MQIIHAKSEDDLKVMRKRVPLIFQIALAGGLASAFGSALVQLMLRNFGFPNRNADLFQSANDSVGLLLAFVSGAVIGAGAAVLWSRRDRMFGISNGKWPKRGLFFGMLAGLANVLLLTLIHIVLLLAPVLYRGELTPGTLINLAAIYALYALVALLVFGIPAAIIGGLTGTSIELILRRNRVTH